jgi:A nuclease of the HNH/ENDO VII superfamily with conserved WHH/Pretoxin HINT domain
VDGEVISTTEEHPFWVPDRGWVEAEDLAVGSWLQLSDGTVVDVDKIEKREGEFEVYNFKVEDFHTYFVSDLGLLVHNAEYSGPKINGRNPINSQYTGEVYPAENLPESIRESYPNGVAFTGDGFPDFSPYVETQVQVDGLVGDHYKDFKAANRAAGYGDTPHPPQGYTWHHHQDGRTMQLVPQDIHSAVKHTGGAAVIKSQNKAR